MKSTSGGGVNWGEIRDRLDRAEAAIRAADQPGPERVREILDARARALALSPPASSQSSGSLDMIVFGLGREQYAIETRYVREAAQVPAVTPLPGVPGHVAGILNLRGKVLPLFDIKDLLGIVSTGTTRPAYVLVLGMAQAELGIGIDSLHAQERMEQEAIIPAGIELNRFGRACVQGVNRHARIILDGAALLQNEHLFINHPFKSQ